MPTLFSKIIDGEIPCYKIAENKFCFSFLDINPLQKGHCLVVPKKEIDKLFDLDTENYIELMKFSKKIAKAIQTTFPVKRIGISVIGFEVPHAHIHLIPINFEGDINFNNPRKEFSEYEFEDIANKISSNF